MPSDVVKLWYLKLRLFDPIDFIVWTIKSCKDKGIRQSEFLAKTQLFCLLLIIWEFKLWLFDSVEFIVGNIKDLRQQVYISPFQGPSPGDIQSMLRKLPYIVLYLSRQSLSESSPEFADIIYQYPTHNVSKLVQVYTIFYLFFKEKYDLKERLIKN